MSDDYLDGRTLRVEQDGYALETHLTEAEAEHLRRYGELPAYWAIEGEPTVDERGFIVEHERSHRDGER